MSDVEELRCSVTGEEYEPNSFADAVHSFIAAVAPEEDEALERLFSTPAAVFTSFTGLLRELEIHTKEAVDGEPLIPTLTRFQDKWLRVASVLLNNQFPNEAKIINLRLYQLVRTLEIDRHQRFHKGTILASLAGADYALGATDQARSHFLLAMIEDIRSAGDGWRNLPARDWLVNKLQVDADTIDEMGMAVQGFLNGISWDPREPELAWLYIKPQRRRVSRAPLEFTKSIANEFLSKVQQSAPTTKEQGDRLEQLVSYLFAVEGGFEVLGPTRTPYSQNDILIRNRHEDGAIASLGDYLIVECKNWNRKRIGASIVRDFAGRLRSTNVKCGVLTSKDVITGMKMRGVGAREIINIEYLRDSTAILVLNETHIANLVAGKLKLSTALLEQFENVRFDIR